MVIIVNKRTHSLSVVIYYNQNIEDCRRAPRLGSRMLACVCLHLVDS